jgi:hypothetical protein
MLLPVKNRFSQNPAIGDKADPGPVFTRLLFIGMKVPTKQRDPVYGHAPRISAREGDVTHIRKVSRVSNANFLQSLYMLQQ